jgi:hypothetical protein
MLLQPTLQKRRSTGSGDTDPHLLLSAGNGTAALARNRTFLHGND